MMLQRDVTNWNVIPALSTNHSVSMRTLCSFLVGIPLWNPEIRSEVQEAENCQEPVEVIKMAPIQIIRDPTKLPTSRCNFSYNGNKQSAQVIS